MMENHGGARHIQTQLAQQLQEQQDVKAAQASWHLAEDVWTCRLCQEALTLCRLRELGVWEKKWVAKRGADLLDVHR